MNKKIARKLKELRGDKKQEDVAKKLGILQSTYSNYERGFRVPKDNIKVKIAKLYGKSVSEIFYE